MCTPGTVYGTYVRHEQGCTVTPTVTRGSHGPRLALGRLVVAPTDARAMHTCNQHGRNGSLMPRCKSGAGAGAACTQLRGLRAGRARRDKQTRRRGEQAPVVRAASALNAQHGRRASHRGSSICLGRMGGKRRPRTRTLPARGTRGCCSAGCRTPRAGVCVGLSSLSLFVCVCAWLLRCCNAFAMVAFFVETALRRWRWRCSCHSCKDLSVVLCMSVSGVAVRAACRGAMQGRIRDSKGCGPCSCSG